MTQPFADALTWVPKSRALGSSLGRAHDLARARSHPAVSLEHLLLALVEDQDAAAVLLSCNIDLLKLNGTLAEHLQQQPAGSADAPEAAPALLTILQYAVAAARQSKRSEINGAIVLAAIIGEGKSEAARILTSLGLKFQDTVAALRRAAASPGPRHASGEPGQEATQAPPEQRQPVPPPPPAAAVTTPTAPPPLPAMADEVAARSEAPMPAAQPRPLAATGVDDDPVTAARRRIAAIRGGHLAPSPGHATSSAGMTPPAMAAQPALTQGNAALAMAVSPAPAAASVPQPSAGGDWAPPPLPQTAEQASRPTRLPPPIPPVSDVPVRVNIAPHERGAQARVPWADGAATETVSQRPLTSKPAIDTAELAGNIPERMAVKAPSIIEIRIPRSAVLATAAATSAQAHAPRSAVLTRALSVRLKAPAGGFFIENAGPETQWFDSQSTQRDDNVVRWRWVVTPHSRGRAPLQLSASIRTVAADGMIVETVLPEYQVSVRVAGNRRETMRGLGKWAVAAFAGAVLALAGTIGLAGLIGRTLN